MLKLQNLINEDQMIAMNGRVKLGGEQEVMVAADFLRESLAMEMNAEATTRVDRLVRYTGQHVALVAASLSVAILLAIPGEPSAGGARPPERGAPPEDWTPRRLLRSRVFRLAALSLGIGVGRRPD